jgi:hypothetical protein
MKQQFIQLTSGWIPVSMLALFAIALIAGQARANLPNEIKAAPVPATTTSVSIVLNVDVLRKLEALPLVVDTLLALPSDLEGTLNTGLTSPFDSGGHSSRSTSE